MRYLHGPLVAGVGATALAVLVAGCGGRSAGFAPMPAGAPGTVGGQIAQIGTPDATACQYSKIVVNFTNDKIRRGDWLWFTSAFAVKRQVPVEFEMKRGRITFDYGNRKFSLRVPDTRVILGGSKTRLDLDYNYKHNAFVMNAPLHTKHRDFMSGVPYRVKFPIPAGVTGATWSAQFFGTKTEKIKWSWGVAVYKRFSEVESKVHIKPLGDDRFSPKNTDPPGSPEAFKKWLIAGGTGNGGSQFTGGKGTAHEVKLCK